jgi:hypothetical protein
LLKFKMATGVRRRHESKWRRQNAFYVAIVGVGGVGAAFLTQLADLSERLSGRKGRPVDI